MSTATANSPRKNVAHYETTTVDLVIAIAEDLKEIVGYRQTGHGSVPIIKLRKGMIYWLLSEVTGKVENTPYQITESTDVQEIRTYLERKMVYIARNPFKD